MYFSVPIMNIILLLLFTTFAQCARTDHPNIIVFVIDDLGWNDVSFHGSPQIPTPNIDALALNGIILNNYYVSPICSPSRSALMTGLHPIHTGLQHDVIYASEPWGLPLDKTILPQWLKKLGYATHAIGKWHLGFFHKKYTPTFRGFDSHYGFWPGRGDYFDHTLQDGALWGRELYNGLNIDKECVGNYSTTLFSKHAVNIINQHNKSKPLFLYVAHQAVHSANSYAPLQAPKKYIDAFPYIKNPNRRTFAGMMSAVDDSVGRIVTALEKKGLLNSSIIVFTTDNGGPAAGFNSNAASNWPLRGVKATLWEGGVRGVGFIWSHLFKKPRVSMQMLHISDWLPTLFHAAGGDVAALGKLDGIDMWNALTKNLTSPRTEILHNIDPITKTAALRVGDFKIIEGEYQGGHWDGWYGPSGRHNTTFSSVWKHKSDFYRAAEKFRISHPQYRDHSAEVECGPVPANATSSCRPSIAPCLFNIRTDPCEYTNLAEKYPKKLKELLQRLHWYNATAVPPRNKPKDNRCDPKNFGYNWVPWMDYL